MDISDSLGLILKSTFFLYLKALMLFLKFVLFTYSVSCSIIDHLPSAYQFLNPTDYLSCLLSVHLLLSILIAVTIVRYYSPSFSLLDLLASSFPASALVMLPHFWGIGKLSQFIQSWNLCPGQLLTCRLYEN